MAAVDSFIVAIRCGGNAPTGLIGKTKYNIAQLTAANIVAQKSACNALGTAESSLTTGIYAAADISVNLAKTGGYPTVTANRGNKWIINATNAAGRNFTYTIPAAFYTGETEADGVTADLTTTEWTAYKSAFEAVATDPVAAALTLNSAKLGGRRR